MFYLQVAGQRVCVENRYDYIEEMCADYIVAPCEPCRHLTMTEAEIMAEQEAGEGYPPAYLETLAIYRKLSEAVLAEDILLVHGSTLAMHGEAVIFTAPSGTGKSTHAALWRRVFGEACLTINDDKPLVQIGEQQAMIYGTPWCGKHGLQTNTGAPLKAIVILARGEENRIEEVSQQEAFAFMMNQVYRMKKPEQIRQIIRLLGRLLGMVRLYRLYCNMEPEAAWTAYRGIFGKEGNTNEIT